MRKAIAWNPASFEKLVVLKMLMNLALSTAMTLIVVLVHLAGLFLLLHFLRANAHHVSQRRRRGNFFRESALIVAVAFGVFALHSAEIWLYALAYLALGAFPDFPTALYFSTTSFSTIGYGDVVLGHEWRLFGAIQGVTGLILIGWSSAFLLSVTSRMRVLEHDWESGGKRKK
jgi:hypothetical protein